MKSLQILAAAAVFATAASALAVGTSGPGTGPTVYIVGSSAYRANVYQAIVHQYNSSGAGNLQYGYSDAHALGQSTYAIFYGTFPGVTDGLLTIKTHFTGSASGIQAVEQPVAQSFLANSTAISAAGTPNASATTDTETPQIAMADVFQASTPFTANSLTDNQVGVVPFVWVASNGVSTRTGGSGLGITNMTPQLAQYQFPSGKIPLSLYTGSSADEGPSSEIPVYATGRDPDSGTRLTAVSETGIGVFRGLKQYKPTANGTAIGSVALYAAQTVNGINYKAGNGGESSGGTLAKNMRLSGSDTVGYLVTYLGTNDARAAALATSADSGTQYSGVGVNAGPAVQLTYNGFGLQFAAPGVAGAVTPDGVAEILNPNVIEEGQYTFWGYEHLDYLPSLSGDPLTAATAIAGQLSGTSVATGTTADAIIPLTSMNVQRAVDGGLVTSLVY